METRFNVPETCLVCGAEWKGGHEVPGKPMKSGLRVFYLCGASLSVTVYEEGYSLLLKGCATFNEEAKSGQDNG